MNFRFAKFYAENQIQLISSYTLPQFSKNCQLYNKKRKKEKRKKKISFSSEDSNPSPEAAATMPMLRKIPSLHPPLTLSLE
jgi:hypothetical protein